MPSTKAPAKKRLAAHRLFESIQLLQQSRDWLAAAEQQAGAAGMGMMLNNSLGCCTIAGAGHGKQVWTANTGTIVTPTDAQILDGYEKADGYNPADPSTDQGGVETDVLTYWKVNDLVGIKIEDFIPVNPSNIDHAMKAIERFGFLYGGHPLPLTAQNESTWFVDPAGGSRALAGSWGGHCVVWPVYDAGARMLSCCTWGMRQGATMDWWLDYTDEAYAIVCSAWYPGGVSPVGDSYQTAIQMLQAVA
jgi:hypothetical protein